MPRLRVLPDFFQPLRRKLPLLISALLCAVVVSFGWLAQRELGLALEGAAEQRLRGAAERLALMLDESTERSRDEVRRVAGDSAISRFVANADAQGTAAAEAALRRQRTATASPVSRALFDGRCRQLLTVGPLAATVTGQWCRAQGAPGSLPTRAWIEPMVARGDTILYGVAAPVLGSNGEAIGFVVQTRSLLSGQNTSQISSLIGEGAAFLIGNATGPSLWTDLAHLVDGPPGAANAGGALTYRPVGGSPQIGVAHALATAPWLVWVQMPAAAVIAPRSRTLWNLAAIAAVCILLGGLGAWAVSNHVTAPLTAVTRAAEGLAGGDYTRRVATTGPGELGQLVTSFNRMATQVEQASEELRVQAEELERQVNEAEALANRLEVSNHELVQAARATKLAQNDTALAQSVLTEVLTRAPVGIAVFDRDLRYVRLNEALATLHGASLEDHVGRRPREVVPELAETKEPMLRRVLETGEPIVGLRLSGVLAGGTKRHWLATFFPIAGPDGTLAHVGAIMLDTTAQHELEEQFLQSQKMEAVGRLAGGVAHDFNNLLTVISSYADLVVESLEPADSRRSDVDEIRRAADRAASLTRQLLAFSRKQVLQPVTLSLNAAVEGVEKMLGRLIGEDVELVTVRTPDLGLVSADPGQVEQVIMNLVVNARDAMPGGGRITIETANVELSEADAGRRIAVPAGPYVMLAVSDTGHGMPPDVLEHLFEPFFTTKAQGEGTGLGLSTVFGIVRQSGGDVWVYSEVGHGTTFKVYLPRLSQGVLPSTSDAAAPSPSEGAETILLAEDDDALRVLAKRVLTRQGYTVIEARNGREALELAAHYEGRIDLVLSDVVMPELGGRALAERLAISRPGTRVLFMSGYTDDDVFRRALIDHRTEFLQKPFTPRGLSERVREVLAGRKLAALQPL